jgi:hypothetical protein
MKELDSYLNDHLAGSVGALELLDHWIDILKGKPLAKVFAEIRNEISSDQETLRDLMQLLGMKESNVRKAGAWAAEKVSRARFASAGDEIGGLGLVLALETLIVGITGKKLLWRAFRALDRAELRGINFAQLEQRAQEQIERIETERLHVVRDALSSPN